MKTSTAKPAFTLIELLVVIAISAILAAMLLPALNRAKYAADSAVCKSNLRQLAIALSMYAEQGGAYPLGGPVEAAVLDSGWASLIQPYTTASFPEPNYDFSSTPARYLGPRQSVYACPGYNRVRGEFLPQFSISGVGSYGYNTSGSTLSGGLGLGAYGSQGPARTATRESQVVSPSDMIALADATLWPGATPVATLPELATGFQWPDCYRGIMYGLPAGDPAVQAIQQRHGGRWNVTFCDAHVENLRAIDLFNLSNSVVAQRWNNDHQPHLSEIMY
jgi:prepilin-type N-terminal cleavage/methylation domain-containing protein/prepilin-type processing-associated H-X9-DG protein